MPICRFCDHNVPAGVRNCPACGAELPDSTEPGESSDLQTELLALLDRGDLIGAVKRYRDATGADLARAKAAIDRLRETRRLDDDLPLRAESSDAAFESELLDLLSGGNKIEAIKRYRERTHVGLKEAKDAVEALAARRGLVVKGSGCLGAMLALLGAGLGALAAVT